MEDLEKENILLKRENALLKANLKKARNNNIHLYGLLRHYKLRIKKISNSLSYLVEHPYPEDTSTNNLIHKRDK